MPKPPRLPWKTCEEIDQLETDADRVMRAAMSKLFREEPDVREVIKLKAIYELLRKRHRQVRGRGQAHRGRDPRELLIREVSIMETVQVAPWAIIFWWCWLSCSTS